MINQSRLSSMNSVASSRNAQDERRNSDNMFSPLGSAQDGGTQAAALNGTQPLNNGSAIAGGNSFSQLLELSKREKPEVQPVKKERSEKQSAAEPKAAKEPEKKEKSDTGVQRKSTKTKEKKTGVEENEQALSQLLTAQQNPSKVNVVDNQNTKFVDIQNPKAQQTTEPVKTLNLREQLNPADAALSKQFNLNQTNKPVTPVDELQNQKSEGPQSLTDIMKALNGKLDSLSNLQDKSKSAVQETVSRDVGMKNNTDLLADVASKFDDVRFEFNPNTENTQATAKVLSGLTAKDQQNGDLMKRMAELEWSQNDLAIRDLISQQSLQEQALERLTLDRLDQLAHLKNGQLDKLQMQDLQSARTLREMMLQDAQASAQPQWLSYRDLSPDQLAMMESMTAGSPMQGGSAQSTSQNNQTGPQISARLANPTESSANVNLTRDAVTGIQSLPSLAQDQSGSASGKQNSSAQSSPQGNDSSALGGVGSVRDAQSKSKASAFDVEEKADAKTRETERHREMARAAALRAQSIASELSAKGGGTAKVQIKDSQLGVIELRINMSDNNKVNVELIANNERIKNELEKQSEELKSGLEKHKVVLEGVRFATDTKLGDNSSQNSSQNDNSRANQQQQQQQQNFSSFSQNGGNNSQQSFGGGERFFEGPRTPLAGQSGTTDSARKNYSGKNDAQTNVQRNANGSLKVTA